MSSVSTLISRFSTGLADAAFDPESFDAVVSVAALHHMDAASGLARFARLTKPGGTVAIVGLAANALWDLPLAAVGGTLRQLLGLARGSWEHSAPTCWPPPLTYGEMKTLSARVLPGVRYRRHWLGRYSLVWRKPCSLSPPSSPGGGRSTNTAGCSR